MTVGDFLDDGQIDGADLSFISADAVSYTHLRAHETVLDLVCRLLLEKKKAEESSAPARSKELIS